MRHKGLLGWRYDSRCNYMITLVTEPRASIFGTLREWGVERSEEGRAVYEAWQAVEARFPGVRATYNAIMPDHFHGIVYIMVEGAADLAAVVAFFAGEVERRIGRRVWCPLWRDSVCLAKGQLHRQIEYVLSNAKRRWIKESNPGLFKKVMGFRHWRLDRAGATLAGVADADGWDFRAFSRDGGGVIEGRELWDIETGEEIAKPRKGNRILRQDRNPEKLKAEVIKMRKRIFDAHPNRSTLFDIKHDAGGMMDIEFIVQYLVLEYSRNYPELTGNLGNIALLKMCEKLGLFSQVSGETVAAIYRHFRRLQHEIRMQGANEAKIALGSVEGEIEEVKKLWREVLGTEYA